MQANAAAGRVYGERPGPVIIPWSATVIVPVIERVRNGQPPAIPSETRSVREEAWKFLPAATYSAFFRHASQRVAAPAKRASRHNLELVRVEGVTSKAIPGPTPGGASTDTQPGARARTQSRLAIAPNARLITLTVTSEPRCGPSRSLRAHLAGQLPRFRSRSRPQPRDWLHTPRAVQWCYSRPIPFLPRSFNHRAR